MAKSGIFTSNGLDRFFYREGLERARKDKVCRLWVSSVELFRTVVYSLVASDKIIFYKKSYHLDFLLLSNLKGNLLKSPNDSYFPGAEDTEWLFI